MARTPASLQSHASCHHSSLTFAPSSCAEDVGYRRPKTPQRATAAGLKKSEEFLDHRFPGPLVLPGDDPACDPKWPPQSYRSWLREPDRNKVTPEKNVIYVANYPQIAPQMRFMRAWAQPQHSNEASIALPNVEHVIEYLAAFYKGLPVKSFPPDILRFDCWNGKTSKTSTAIALNTRKESIKVGVRTPPDRRFSRQLNLNDVLEVAISVLPRDAYALLLLVEQDL